MTKIVKTAIKMQSKISSKKKDIIVATTPVNMEASETYLNKYSVNTNVIIMARNNNGFTPNIIPPEVATALPPLNLAKTG